MYRVLRDIQFTVSHWTPCPTEPTYTSSAPVLTSEVGVSILEVLVPARRRVDCPRQRHLELAPGADHVTPL